MNKFKNTMLGIVSALALTGAGFTLYSCDGFAVPEAKAQSVDRKSAVVGALPVRFKAYDLVGTTWEAKIASGTLTVSFENNYALVKYPSKDKSFKVEFEQPDKTDGILVVDEGNKILRVYKSIQDKYEKKVLVWFSFKNWEESKAAKFSCVLPDFLSIPNVVLSLTEQK